ncbi:MAG: prepilin-type N-terminal cleavage/methylation domain-containing protein [Candidatus Acidiferrales bacterium]
MSKPNIKSARFKQQSGRGFSLIELLIVVAIILIIAAIAIPSLLRAKLAANQSAAVENCRSVTSAQVLYYTSFSQGFAPSLIALGGPAGGAITPANAQLIDDGLSSGVKSGYTFTYVPLAMDSSGNYQDYSLNADPQAVNLTGVNHYFTDEPSVIHWSAIGAASVNDPSIQ